MTTASQLLSAGNSSNSFPQIPSIMSSFFLRTLRRNLAVLRDVPRRGIPPWSGLGDAILDHGVHQVVAAGHQAQTARVHGRLMAQVKAVNVGAAAGQFRQRTSVPPFIFVASDAIPGTAK